VSVNKLPSVLAAWQALYRHSKSPHWYSLTMVSGAIIIIIIINTLPYSVLNEAVYSLCCCSWNLIRREFAINFTTKAQCILSNRWWAHWPLANIYTYLHSHALLIRGVESRSLLDPCWLDSMDELSPLATRDIDKQHVDVPRAPLGVVDSCWLLQGSIRWLYQSTTFKGSILTSSMVD